MSETEKKTGKLHPSRFGVATFKTNRWHATVESGSSYETIRDVASYWTHITTLGKLKPCDIIEVHADDMSFYAELYVTAVEKQAGATVVELFYKKLERAVPLVSEAYYIEYAGPHHKNRIVRLNDKLPVEWGFGSRDEALAAAARSNKRIVEKPADKQEAAA